MKQTGLTLASFAGGCQELIEQAVEAEALGYSALWFADTGYPDPLTLAGQVIAATSKADIGIAVVPAYTRTPAVLASSTATLNELSGGRFILGLGSSSQTMMNNWHGIEFDKPLTRVCETVELIRNMMTGEKSNYEGSTVRSRGFRMPPVQNPQRIYMAALRAKMLETAAEHADGIILNLYPQQALPRIIEHIKIGAKRAGKTLDDIDIVTRYQVAVTESGEDEINLFRLFYGPYFATPVYNRFLGWAGYPDVAKELTEAFQAGDRERTHNAFTEELVREIAVVGSLEECHARIAADLKAGVTTAMITTASADKVVRTKTLHAFAADVFDANQY